MDSEHQKHCVRRSHFLISPAAGFLFDVEKDDTTDDDGEKAEKSKEGGHSSVTKEKRGFFNFLTLGRKVEKEIFKGQPMSKDPQGSRKLVARPE
jgi:hypothetical protein